jgi:hypothetical protein
LFLAYDEHRPIDAWNIGTERGKLRSVSVVELDEETTVWRKKRTDANYLSRNIPRSDEKAADSADCLTGSFTAGRMNAPNTKMCCISVSKCAVDLGTNGNSAHCMRTTTFDVERTHTHTRNVAQGC